jgi:hypothetical protein
MKRIQNSAGGRRRGPWRAVAGMAICLSIGFAIMFGIVANNRSDVVRSPATSDPLLTRIAASKKMAAQPERRLAPAQRSLRDASEQVEQRNRMDGSKGPMMAVLIAPDHETIKLTSPNPGDIANGTATVSRKMEGAVLSLHALPSPPAGKFCNAWWMLKNAPPAKAGEFVSGIDQSIYLDPPPQGSIPISFAITIESSGATKPSGRVMLEGKFPERGRQIATREKKSAGPGLAAEGQERPRFAATPSLQSWYLVVPPLDRASNRLDRTASQSRWSIIGSFDTHGECSNALRGPGGKAIYRVAVCMAANDPRLKSY